MAISDLLNAREFPVDRDAYRYLERYVPFNYPSVNVLATSSHFQYDRTVKDRKEQLTRIIQSVQTVSTANSQYILSTYSLFQASRHFAELRKRELENKTGRNWGEQGWRCVFPTI